MHFGRGLYAIFLLIILNHTLQRFLLSPHTHPHALPSQHSSHSLISVVSRADSDKYGNPTVYLDQSGKLLLVIFSSLF